MRNLSIEMKMRISLRISYFKQDFLEIEVLKGLAIDGEQLLYHIKEEYREDAKQYGKLFSKEIMYHCKNYSNGYVNLVGVYI